MVGCLYQPAYNAISFCNTPHHSNFSPFGAVSFTLPLITPVHQHTFGNVFFLPLCCAILRTCLIFAFKFLSLHLKRPFIVNLRQHQGLLSRVAESEVFGWTRSPKNTGNRSFFCPSPDVQLHHFLHHTLKLGIPVEMARFLLKLLLKHISFFLSFTAISWFSRTKTHKLTYLRSCYICYYSNNCAIKNII